ncbi:TPA: SDR family NAD(P)-dependent oxidoreductase [Streptococcus suis 2651]|uniref:SDR family NAD(P)-dependent oxidoreductase n=1 Tax=Streptococcus suis TaxID=1307 RepID=UPI000426C689|nr:SDR family NAD(P)-dependent oxidoreductase [Streptococcus suis]HEL1668872.1 SDR family NAD(P)-dependent oxidoreductase [Streptococcus suis]HEL1754138.1 SDR family NAD(P)-dependent oxidoreductase [Streptococcus suis]HEM3220429.1 SDR family NAD(P)-dependent oxidoreductase [Streptococcus suis 2651]
MKRNVLITGASSGIGKAIAYVFAANGDNIIITGRRLDKLEEIKQDIEKQYHVQVSVHSFDVTNMEQTIVNCQKILEEYDLTDMMTMIDTNIKGLLTVTRQLLPQMVENNEGHIINIGSTAGIYAYAGAAVYAATKSAVKVLSDGIRIDTIDKNIKVTTLQPGIVETDFSQVRFHGDKERAATVYQGIDALQANDIASCTLFVANQPAHVQISDMTIMATKQATGFTIHRD